MAAAAHPVRTLRELVTSLGAAITLVLADPKPRSIHDLRTGTRRIEAQLELLALLPDLPRHAKPAKKAGKLLRKVRRAAGSVRDLDVQRNIVASKSREAAELRKVTCEIGIRVTGKGVYRLRRAVGGSRVGRADEQCSRRNTCTSPKSGWSL